MPNIIKCRIYDTKENSSGSGRDVLYPETGIESIITREANGAPITLKEDIGPKFILGDVTGNEPNKIGRTVVQAYFIDEYNIPAINYTPTQ